MNIIFRLIYLYGTRNSLGRRINNIQESDRKTRTEQNRVQLERTPSMHHFRR